MSRVTRARALNALRIGLLVVIVAACVVALWANWQEVSGQLRKLSVPVVLGAFAFVAFAPILTLMGWRVLLEDLGTHLALPPASSVFLVGQLGKYLPGSVWTVVAQAEMGARLKVPRRRMAVVGILSIGLAVLTGLLLGIPAVQPLAASQGTTISWWWVALAVLLGSVLLWPRLLNAVIARGAAAAAARAARARPVGPRGGADLGVVRGCVGVDGAGHLRAGAAAWPRRRRRGRCSSPASAGSPWRPRPGCSACSCPPGSGCATACSPCCSSP